MDSDTISKLLRNPGQHIELERRVREASPGTILVSVVSVAELMQGALAFVRRLEKTD